MVKKMTLALAMTGIVLLVVTGCSGYQSPRFGGSGDLEDGPGYDQYQEQLQYDEPEQEPPTESEIRQMTEDHLEEMGVAGWSCSYEPTMNDDWHDDVLCRNADQLDRPYLREWDSYVTQDEIMESAREYEAQLNATP